MLPKLTTLIVTLICLHKHSVSTSEPTQSRADSHFKDFIYTPSGNNIIWPSKKIEESFLSQGNFDPQDMIATRLIFFEDNVVILFPKFRRGVPFSVASMNIKCNDRCEPDLYPYPSWTDHDSQNCDAIVNAVDLFLDPNDVIWILDVGIVNTLDEPKTLRAPKVIGIDAKCGKIIFSIPLGMLTTPQSRLQFVVAEKVENETLLYISDAGTRSIIVYNVHIPKGFRIVLPSAICAGAKRKDVLYLTIIHISSIQVYLYFTYLGASELFKVETRYFRVGQIHGVIESAGLKPAKLVLLGTDNGPNIFFRFQGDNIIYMWNTQTQLHHCNFILVTQPNYQRMATHIVAGYRRLLWMLESNFHDYISDNVGCLGASTRLLPIYKICDS